MEQNQRDNSEAEKAGNAMTDATEPTDSAADGLKGQRAVKLLLIERLEAAGYVRPPRMTVEVFDAAKRHLAERLAWMSADGLQTLAQIIIDTSPFKRDWPMESWILLNARRIETEPVTENRTLTSWLASIEGPKAVARGDLVEVFRFVRDKRRPPTALDMRDIAEKARDRLRRVAVVNDKIRHGVCPDEDRKWLQSVLDDEQAALALVDMGNRRREGQAA